MKRTVLIVILFLLSLSASAKVIILRHTSIKNTANQMQVSLFLSATPRLNAFTLRNPNRYVIDLNNTKSIQPLRFHWYRGSPVKNVKYARHSDGVMRIVFELNSSKTPQYHVFRIVNHHQMVVKIIFYKTKSAVVKHQSIIRHSRIKKKSERYATHHPITRGTEHAVLTDTASENTSGHYRKIIVVIDPGHGGKDPGATGPGGAHEKNIVLSISKKLQRQINQQPGFEALLTRTGDYYLTLRQRLAIARKDKADMFIAIHADIWRNKTASGVSVFALSQRGATSEAARWLAKRENASELMGGVSLQDKSHLLKSVLIDLSQAATIRSSLEIGNDLLSTIRPIARLHHDRVEQAAFVVLKSPDIPSLLVETGFLSNQREERKLRNSAYQHKLAVAIMRGIDEHFVHNPPRGTWLSYWRRSHSARLAFNKT